MNVCDLNILKVIFYKPLAGISPNLLPLCSWIQRWADWILRSGGQSILYYCTSDNSLYGKAAADHVYVTSVYVCSLTMFSCGEIGKKAWKHCCQTLTSASAPHLTLLSILRGWRGVSDRAMGSCLRRLMPHTSPCTVLFQPIKVSGYLFFLSSVIIIIII